MLQHRSKLIVEAEAASIGVLSKSNFIEITLCHGRSPVNLLHIFSTPFPKNNYGIYGHTYGIFARMVNGC